MSGRALKARVGRGMLAIALLSTGAAGELGCSKTTTRELAVTVGDLHAVHAPVFLGELQLQGERRVSEGDSVRTGDDGRARFRLDDGTIVAVAEATGLSLRSGRLLELSSGRIFVQAGPHAAATVSLGGARTTVAGSAVAFEAAADVSKVTVSSGEVVLQHAAGQTRIESGETATLSGQGVTVVPEKAFVDWTGGLAVPWTSELGGNTSIGIVRSVAENQAPDDPGTAMVVRSVDVDVQLHGELALTRSTTRYFNGSSAASSVPVRLSLPDGAILSRVARRDAAGGLVEGGVAIASSPQRPNGPAMPGLEWAGGGWLRGELGAVGAGQTVELILEYTQWLPTRSGKAAYRFAMDGGDEPPLIGEFEASVTAERDATRYLSVSQGGIREGRTLRFRAADVRPTSDLVVEFENAEVEAGVARAYVATPAKGGDPYLMVRTELPERSDASVTLAVVVDASMSIGTASLETQRAVVDAIVAGLGPQDSVVVLAADQGVVPLGPAAPSAATDEVKSDIAEALSALRPGGATHLRAALEGAADLLDAPSRKGQAGSGMVVYVGDGRATVGELDAVSIRRRLSKRAEGMPRLSAIAVGANADRWMLGELVDGVGTVYEVADRAEAARAGAAVLSDALQPTFRDVALELGPSVDRIYPRQVGTLVAGSTVTVLGRLRGDLPKKIGIRYRDGTKLVEETRRLRPRPRPPAADLGERWAMARIQEMALRDEGIEPAIRLAQEAGLLTPWTGWFFQAPQEGQATRPFNERLLGLSPASDAAFGARISPLSVGGSALLEPHTVAAAGVSLKEAAAMAIRRLLGKASKAVQACRDARVSVRPDVSRHFSIALSVDAEGHASRVVVDVLDTRGGDAVLSRCIERVAQALPYFGVGVAVDVRHQMTVPEGRSLQRTKCSEAAKVSLPIRKMLWRTRQLDAAAFIDAARTCELPRWNDRRALLLLLLEQRPDNPERLRIAAELESEGEVDAAQFVREQTLRNVTSFSELEWLTALLRQDEPNIDHELNRAYEAAKSDAERLTIVRRFLRLAPHSELARSRLLALLEAIGERQALIDAIQQLRSESIADAGLLARGASALRRLGLEQEARRAFSELIERAPRDPWTLAYVGDRLRAEGLFDEATTAYESLLRVMPDDAGVSLRLSLAHQGAGRLDVATRLLERVTQTGGRGDDGRLGELAAVVEALLLAEARGGHSGPIEAELQRRLLRTPLPDVAGLVVVRSPPADDAVDVSIVRAEGERLAQSADLDARALGLSVIRLERGEGRARIALRRPRELGPSRPRKVLVAALLMDEGEKLPRLIQREVEVPADGQAVELEFDGVQLL